MHSTLSESVGRSNFLHSQTQHQFKGGDLFIHSIDYPTEVAPGGVVDVRIEVHNESNLIPQFDDDQDVCSGALFNGWEYGLIVDTPFEGVSDFISSTCLTMESFGTATATHQFDLQIPEDAPEEPFTMQVEMFLPESQERVVTEHEIVVSSDAPERPGPGDGDDGLSTWELVAIGGGASVVLLALGGLIL